MATVTEYDAASVASTTDGATRVSNSFTPNAGELLLVLVIASGTVTTTPTLTSSANGISFAYVGRAQFGPTLHSVYWFVAKRLVPASPAAMTVTFTATGDNHTGAIVQVCGVAGMTRVGLDAIRQSVIISDGTGGTTPSFVFGSNVLTGNPTLYALGEISTAGILTPTNWTEGAENSYSTPTIGGGYGYRNSGFTGTTVTWPGTETAHGGIFIELDTSAAPDTRAEVERTNSSAGSYADWQWEVTFTEDVEITRFLYFARLAKTYDVQFNGVSIGSQAVGADSNVDITLGSPYFVASGATLTIKIIPSGGGSTIYFTSGTGSPIVGSGADKVSFWGNFRAPSSGGTANNSHGVLVWQTPSGGTPATFATTAGDSSAGGGSSTFTGAGSFATSSGNATGAGGSSTATGAALFTSLAGGATGGGGVGTLAGAATFTTAAGDVTAAGGSSAFAGAATFSTTAGNSTGAGSSSTLTGAALFTTLAGDAAGGGGVSTFTAGGAATFTTAVGDAAASGGSSTFTGAALFATVAGDVGSSGGTATFNGAAMFATSAGSVAVGGSVGAFTTTATFITTAGNTAADGGTSGFVVTVENALPPRILAAHARANTLTATARVAGIAHATGRLPAVTATTRTAGITHAKTRLNDLTGDAR